MAREELKIGQLRRQSRLQTEAVYRVIGTVDDVVEVEVVSAPGLTPGHRFRFTRAAVSSMDVLSDESVEPGA